MSFNQKRVAFAVVQAIAAMAVGTQALAQSGDPQKVEKIEVTGSSIKRVDAETALPVTIIRREDIERTGVTTAEDLLKAIPSNFGGAVAANNVGATGGASEANLRSLGSKYTLVLLNGRRLANFAFLNSPVDLNSIPVSAIERVEILRDGASAIYGADAIAGVINFILRKDYRGAEVSGYISQPQAKGGGDTWSVNVAAGFGDLNKDRFNAFITFNHEEGTALKAKDRDFANTANRPDLGINKASPRNGIPNLNFTDTLGNKYTGVNPLRYSGCNSPEFALVIRDATTCGTDYVKFIDLIPKAKHDSAVGRLVFQLNADHQLYAEAVYTKDDSTSTYSPSPYTKSLVYPTTGRWYPTSIVIPKGYTTTAEYLLANGSVLPKGTVLTNDITVTPTGTISGTWRTVAGGGRTDITEAENSRLLLGSKGTIAGWDYDAGYAYSKNQGTIYFGPGKFSYEKLTPLVASGEINIFGPQDAASLAKLNGALLSGPQQTATSTAGELDLRASKEIMQTANGPIGFAVGTSFRREKLDQFSFPVLESGDEVGGSGPIPGVTGSRKVYAAFAETSVPLMKNLELQAAARYDGYKNSFGTSFNKLSPKVALRFQPNKDMVLRGSFAQGFRAPTLYENLRPFTSGNNTNSNYNDPVRCPGGTPVDSVNPVGELQDECNVQLTTALQGNRDVAPEKSKQFSFGFAFQPTNNMSVSLDYWDVTISNAIVAKSEIQVFGDPVKYRDYFYRYDPVNDPDQLNPIRGSTNPDFPLAYVYLPYENAAKIFGAGVDLNLTVRNKLDNLGTATLNFDGTLFTKHGYQYTGIAKTSDLGKYKDFGPSPRWRHAITLGWNRGPWTASVTHNYTAGYEDYTDTTKIDPPTYPTVRKVGAYQTFDVQGGWKGIKNLELVLGVKNLLDKDPPASRTETDFQTGYDATFTNPLGRTFYVRAKYKFF